MSKEVAEQPEDQITLVDENGNEHLYNILLTFSSDDYNRSYVFIYPAEDADNDEINIEAYALPKGNDPTDPDEEGELEPIEDEDEWNMVQEVLNTFIEDQDDEQK